MFNEIGDPNVYKCEMLAVCPSATVKPYSLKRSNIETAETYTEANIMVKPTLSTRYVKEIITGRKIPVYFVDRDMKIGTIYYKEVPNKPYYVMRYINNCVTGAKDSFAENIATEEEIKRYLKDNMSLDGTYDDFTYKLDKSIEDANKYYDLAISKVKEENAKMKTLLRSVKKTKKN